LEINHSCHKLVAIGFTKFALNQLTINMGIPKKP
jgi:hypothetical protein